MRKSTQTAEYRRLREVLAEVREEAGLSQRALAERLGVPHSWVAKVETGERRIDLIEFCWFAAACGVDALGAARRVIDQIKPVRTRRKARAR